MYMCIYIYIYIYTCIQTSNNLGIGASEVLPSGRGASILSLLSLLLLLVVVVVTLNPKP